MIIIILYGEKIGYECMRIYDIKIRLNPLAELI